VPDHLTANGVVHIIDTVLMPNIVQLAAGTPDLSKLVVALTKGDLVGALSAPGSFTVFAPTDDAFDKLTSPTLAALLLPANKATLVQFLKYHVVSGSSTLSTALSDGANTLTTLHGAEVVVTKAGGAVTIGDAKVTVPDHLTANGVVHIIDTVLMPNIVQLAAGTPDLSKLVVALTKGDLVGALSAPGSFTVFAPTNAAFDKLTSPTVAELLLPASKATLVKILKYHVISGSSTSAGDLSEGATELTTLQGSKVTVTKAAGGAVTIGDVKVTMPDQVALNGMVHIIDTVLMPPSTSTSASSSTGASTTTNATTSGCVGCRLCISWAITLSVALCFSILAV